MKKAFILLILILMPSSALSGQPEPVEVLALLKTSSSWDGNPLPSYPKGTPEITIARITIQPGGEIFWHKHPMINAGVLLTGEITVTTEEQKSLQVKAGQAIAEVVNTWHRGKNEGEVPAEIIVFYAGTAGTPITLKK